MPAVEYGFFAGPLSQVTRTNLILNPSAETNTNFNGPTGAGSTGVRSSDQAYAGSFSVKWDFPSTLANPLYIFNSGASSARTPVTVGQTYTFSVYLFAATPASYRVDIRWATAVTGGTVVDTNGTASTITGSTWTRYTVTGVCPVGYTHAQFHVVKPSNTVTGTVYIDAALFEQSATAGTYFDGTDADPWPDHFILSQQWNGTANNSTSTTVWQNQIPPILDNYTSFTVTKGRQQVQDPFKAGTATVTGLNISTVSGLNIGDTLTIKVVAINGSPVSTTIFNGLIANITADYGFTPEEDRWTIEADDALAAAGRAYTSNSFGAGVTTAIAATLSSSGTFVGVVEPYPTTAASRVSAQTFNNNNLLDIINQLIATEQGRLVASDPLTILFYNRNTQNLFGTLCNFTDGSVSSALPALKYQQIVFRSRAESFFTRTIVEPEGLAAQTAGTGQRTFTMQSYDQTTSQASDLAGYVLATLDVSQDAPSTISYIAENQDSSVVLIGLNAATETLGAQRSLLVTLRGAQYACFVEGSTISADPTRTRFTLNLSSSEAAAGFILDDTILGVLDTSKLGF